MVDAINPQQQTVKDGGVMIPPELYATLPRAFQIGWESLSGPQQQQIVVRASHSLRVNNDDDDDEEKEEDNAHDAPRRPRAAAAAAVEDEEDDYDLIGRALLTEWGFDPEDLNKRDRNGYTPMINFSMTGNIQMCRYLAFRGADCREAEEHGWFPLFCAAGGGYLEIVRFLCHECGAHDDIQRQIRHGTSPLRVALHKDHFHITQWLTLNGALELSRDDIAGGGIDDEIMRRDLRQGGHWRDDKRLPLLLWAQDVVRDHDNFQSFLTSTAFTFNGKQLPGELELIAQYVGGTTQQLRTLLQLIVRLGEFIDDVRFVIRGEEDADADE